MQLDIKNIGKLSNAHLDLKGITIIAGENNTGKSTIGKALYTVAHCLDCLNEKSFYLFKARNIARIIAVNDNISVSFSRLVDIIYSILSSQKVYDCDNLFALLSDATEDPAFSILDAENPLLNNMLKFDQVSFLKSRIEFYNARLFGNQLATLYDSTGDSSIRLHDVDEGIAINLAAPVTDIPRTNLQVKAHYIDDPFALDLFPSSQWNIPIFRKCLYPDLDLAVDNLINENEDDYLVREMMVYELGDAYKKLDALVKGKLIKGSSDLASYKIDDLAEPLKICNLSAGFKSLLILKLLLDGQQISNGDILIFDEPEIHLHPEWQMKYAEILVELQEKMNLKIVITSHSPAFIRFIETYSYIRQRMQYLTVYHTVGDNTHPGMFKVVDLTNSEYGLSEIYEKLSAPYAVTDDLIAEFERKHYGTN